jgi:hypothetical protein
MAGLLRAPAQKYSRTREKTTDFPPHLGDISDEVAGAVQVSAFVNLASVGRQQVQSPWREFYF